MWHDIRITKTLEVNIASNSSKSENNNEVTKHYNIVQNLGI